MVEAENKFIEVALQMLFTYAMVNHEYLTLSFHRIQFYKTSALHIRSIKRYSDAGKAPFPVRSINHRHRKSSIFHRHLPGSIDANKRSR